MATGGEEGTAVTVFYCTELSAPEALRRSREMMRGAKTKYFWMLLSFIGWYLLVPISFGIVLIWLGPYLLAARTKFYDDLKANQIGGAAQVVA